MKTGPKNFSWTVKHHPKGKLMSPCLHCTSDSVWCFLPHFGDGNRKEWGGSKARLIKKSHHSGCLVVTHYPMHVAVPMWVTGCLLATMEVTGTVRICVSTWLGREKKSWRSGWALVSRLCLSFVQKGALRRGAEGRAELLLLPHHRWPGWNKCPRYAAPWRNPKWLLHHWTLSQKGCRLH